jgi:Skp family chaperone for outer membrane proteins
MVGRAFVCAVLLALTAPASAVIAQDAAGQSAVLTIDPERLFAESRFGIAYTARLEAQQSEFLAENRKLEAALEAEEKDLTERRPGLPAAEFRQLADAFDKKAEEIRSARLVKSRSLTTARDEDRKEFLASIQPILGEMMDEMGALVILDKRTVFIWSGRIDVTDRAIARIDAAMDDDLKSRPAPLTPDTPAP